TRRSGPTRARRCARRCWRCSPPNGTAIDIGRVEKRDAELDRPMDGGDGLGVIAVAVEIGHAHAAKPHRGHDKALGPQMTLFHVFLSPLEGGYFRSAISHRSNHSRFRRITSSWSRGSPTPCPCRGYTTIVTGTWRRLSAVYSS